MKRVPFELVVTVLILGIVAMAAVAGILIAAIADRELTPARDSSVSNPPMITSRPAITALAITLVASTPAPHSTRVPTPIPGTQAAPPLPTDHPAFDPATQPCESCHDPHGG